jgi:hypothetical protein
MKELLLFESTRRFGIYSFFGQQHNSLLLRSMKSKINPTRIDIGFMDTRAMEIRVWFEGLTIFEVDAAFLNNFRSKPAELIEPGNRVYQLLSKGWEGFIVAGDITYKEDNEIYSAPSKITSADILKPIRKV